MSNEYILIVDDEPDIRNLISDILQDEGYSVATAANGQEANQQLDIQSPHLILLDIWMPDIDGISLMKTWLETQKVTAPIVMMSGHGTVETAVEATRLGAKDFIEKPLSLAKLLQTVSETLEKYKPQEQSSKPTPDKSLQPIGSSSAIQDLKNSLKLIYPSKSHVLIYGDSGVGKTTLAHLIHSQRTGTNSNLVNLDFSLVEDKDLESVLCDASQGLFVKAGKGHLALYNLELMTTKQQSLMKSLLKTQQFQSGSQSVPLDFTILSVVNGGDLSKIANLDSELLELLSELKLYVPSLKERPEDIPELLNHYVNTLPDEENTPYRKLSFAVQNQLRNHVWSNNLTELKNTVRQLLLNKPDGDVELDELSDILNSGTEYTDEFSNDQFNQWCQQPLREARESFEKAYLVHHLRDVDGRVGELAKIAGMERTHLYRKLRALNINPKNIDDET